VVTDCEAHQRSRCGQLKPLWCFGVRNPTDTMQPHFPTIPSWNSQDGLSSMRRDTGRPSSHSGIVTAHLTGQVTGPLRHPSTEKATLYREGEPSGRPAASSTAGGAAEGRMAGCRRDVRVPCTTTRTRATVSRASDKGTCRPRLPLVLTKRTLRRRRGLPADLLIVLSNHRVAVACRRFEGRTIAEPQPSPLDM
jgi:hypothetical protein